MNNERLSFYINKKIIYVDIERTTNKNMYLKINGTDIVLSANKRTSLSSIKSFVEEHIENFVKYLDEKKESELFSINKGFVWIGGVKYKLISLTGFSKPSGVIKGDSFYANVKEGKDEEVGDCIKDFLKSFLLKKIEKIQPKFEKKMNITTHTFSVRYKTSTWATNSLQQQNISYSSRLAHYNDKIIEYVVVHELAHYTEPNHSKDFWAIVEEFEVNYKAIRKQLKENKTPTN